MFSLDELITCNKTAIESKIMIDLENILEIEQDNKYRLERMILICNNYKITIWEWLSLIYHTKKIIFTTTENTIERIKHTFILVFLIFKHTRDDPPILEDILSNLGYDITVLQKYKKERNELNRKSILNVSERRDLCDLKQTIHRYTDICVYIELRLLKDLNFYLTCDKEILSNGYI